MHSKQVVFALFVMLGLVYIFNSILIFQLNSLNENVSTLKQEFHQVVHEQILSLADNIKMNSLDELKQVQQNIRREVKEHISNISSNVNNLIQNNIRVAPAAIVDSKRLCTENPYISSFNSSIQEIANRADVWMQNQDNILLNLLNYSRSEYNHKRFNAFQEISSCTNECVGGKCSDGESKKVCGISSLQNDCIIYSMGSNNEWEFELDILDKTPCHVHSFDCTGSIRRFKVPKHPRLHFHHTCFGSKYVPDPNIMYPKRKDTVNGEIMTLSQIQKMLNHTRIDLLKFDIEGYEWPIFDSWPELTDAQSLTYSLPYQILVEVHYKTQMKELSLKTNLAFKFETDFIRLVSHLYRVGYATMIRNDNPRCKHCTELTLIRYRCHE